jgi:hypothetical protein
MPPGDHEPADAVTVEPTVVVPEIVGDPVVAVRRVPDPDVGVPGIEDVRAVTGRVDPSRHDG